MAYLKVFKLDENASIPQRQHDTDAGYDIFSSEVTTIKKRSSGLVRTSIAISFSPDHYARLCSRSGLSVKNGIEVGAGVIDSGYRGEVKVLLYNHSDEHFHIYKGDKIAQMILHRIDTPNIEQVTTLEQLGDSDRGVNGFGSTGVHSSYKVSGDGVVPLNTYVIGDTVVANDNTCVCDQTYS